MTEPPAAHRLQVDAVCRRGVGPVSFTAEPGTFVAVTGPGSSGKSTVVGVVAGFDRPDSGRVLLDGVDVHVMSRTTLDRLVGWLGAVLVSQERTKRPVPRLVVGDDPEAPFVVEATNSIAAVAQQLQLDRRLRTLMQTIRAVCEQGVRGGHRHDARRADPLR